jgi:hypothetical protein
MGGGDAADDRSHSLSPRRREHGPELVFGHACLLRPDVLHVQAEDAGELRQVVGVAAGRDQSQHVTAPDRVALVLIEPVARAVGVLVPQELRRLAASLKDMHILLSA